MKRPYKTISSQIVWSCPWYRIRQDKIITPDGSNGVYNVVEHPGAVWIIPVTPASEIILINTYRYTVDEWCYEIPAGGIKPGQSIEESAYAELREEVGGSTDQMEYFGQFFTMNGIGNEVAHVFIATNVVMGQPNHESTEVMTICPKPIEEVLRMAQTNEIADGPSALALLLCADKLRQYIKSSD